MSVRGDEAARRPTRRGGWAGATAGAIAAVASAVAASSAGQTFDVERPRTLVVGTPRQGARTSRLDGARSGWSRSALPSSGLRTEWRTPLGTLVEQAPLVDVHGTSYVVGARGEVVAVARDGTERWRVSTGAAQPGPPALLSDDTLVFADAVGQAVAVRDGAVRWRARFGRADPTHPAPLPLDDGGVVVGTSRELAALDAEGRERARTTLPEATAAPLLWALGAVVAVTTSGAIWTWVPGAIAPTRVATFGSALDGGAALVGDHTLVGVVAGQAHVTAVDLAHATTETRAIAPSGLWLGPPAIQGGAIYVELLTTSGELAITLDASGAEVARSLLALHPPAAAVDGGANVLVAGPHTAPLVDAEGTLVFATMAGAIGIVGGSGARVERLDQDLCEPPLGSAARSAPPVVGFAPLEPGAFVAACHAGALLAVRGQRAASERTIR